VQGVLIRRFGQSGGPRERREGWTWRTVAGAPVLSPAAARVDYAGPLKGWGPVVILNVGESRRLVLAGMQEVAVGLGRAVARGEPIGRMGPARKGPDHKGRLGPELYLEVRDGDTAVNPARWLAATAQNSSNGSANQAVKSR
jgi:septal ring factor EnvC (AmiA/AmiB activator)